MDAPLYKNIPSDVGTLLRNVENGKIGLPDLQRPFVWKDRKVRELLDSMMKGFPIGYIMLWKSPDNFERASHIGDNDKMYSVPDELVIDGQQRLTALLAALYGVTVKDKDYKERNIRISYNPLSKEFAVWSMGYENKAEWISSVNEVFEADKNKTLTKFRKEYIHNVNDARAKVGQDPLTDDEEDIIEDNLNRLLWLEHYSLPTLEISSVASEEDVSEIFVRVNSGGQKLTEKNFIETLLAVFDNEVHKKIDLFCSQSRIPQDGTSYNQIIALDPSHLIRMAVGVGFHRARLMYAYMLLRGKDLKTGEITAETRKQNLQLFKDALDKVVNLNNWHAFLNAFADAGYIKGNIVASSNAVVFSYVLYLIGKYEYKVNSVTLKNLITRWVFVSTVTLFYTGSTESEVEKQFADLRGVHDADEFVTYLDDVIASQFTDDFFNITLINGLSTSSANSPYWFAYLASLNVLGTNMLFSTSPLSKYFVVGSSGKKKAIDKHHIFPKHYLTEIGFDDDRDRNQIANFTYIDYNTNIDISDDAPSDYVPRMREKLGDEAFLKTCRENALPDNFENMEYQEFLKQRRLLMSKIIRMAYDRLPK